MGYWAAARLFVQHQNPYSATLLLATERSAGWTPSYPRVMQYPPWALPVIASLGWMSFPRAQIVWMLLSTALIIVTVLALWRYFGAPRRRSWIAVIVALTFMPLGTVTFMGQITPLILAALTGLLYLLRARRWFLAGVAFLIVFGIKPHLLWLLGLALLLWTWRERRWSVPGGAFTSIVISTIAAVLWNPSTIHFVGNTYGAAMEANCGVGGVLRLFFGRQHIWLQYSPLLPGIVWFAWYWNRHRKYWHWEERLPLILLVSIGTAPYFWFHDYLLAMPAFIALAARGAWRSRWVLFAWVAIQWLTVLPSQKAEQSAVSLLWIPFWVAACRQLENTGDIPAEGLDTSVVEPVTA